jgi:hypothetical protein
MFYYFYCFKKKIHKTYISFVLSTSFYISYLSLLLTHTYIYINICIYIAAATRGVSSSSQSVLMHVVCDEVKII